MRKSTPSNLSDFTLCTTPSSPSKSSVQHGICQPMGRKDGSPSVSLHLHYSIPVPHSARSGERRRADEAGWLRRKLERNTVGGDLVLPIFLLSFEAATSKQIIYLLPLQFVHSILSTTNSAQHKIISYHPNKSSYYLSPIPPTLLSKMSRGSRGLQKWNESVHEDVLVAFYGALKPTSDEWAKIMSQLDSMGHKFTEGALR